jgi:hypothetical protein
MDVVSHGLLERVPVGVVGVVDDELADRPEVTLDPVQEAGVGWSEHQLDVVVLAHWRMSGVDLQQARRGCATCSAPTTCTPTGLHGGCVPHKSGQEVLGFYRQIRMRYRPKIRIYFIVVLDRP